MRHTSGCTFLLSVGLFAQQKQPDLIGTLRFDVGSDAGRVETLAIQIGDGGSGRYKAILAGDSSLPTHAIYRPRDLSPFSAQKRLPVVAFGNGGCRNSSGEFRNFLSDVASHGYLVVAIGPAGDALVSGSEGRTGITDASQLLEGVDWIAKENARQESEYYQKIDMTKVALMGQSCGTGQALQVSADPRVTTTVLLNGGPGLARPSPSNSTAATAAPAGSAQRRQGPGAYGGVNSSGPNIMDALNNMARRYAPFGPPMTFGTTVPPEERAKFLTNLHGPIALINGGPSDMAYAGALAAYESIQSVPVLLAWQDVGHYPATFRQPNGGAFAVAVNAWLDWHLKGDRSARSVFVGAPCGLCKDPKWTVKIKNVH